MMGDKTWLKKVIEPLPSKRMQEAIIGMFESLTRDRDEWREKAARAGEKIIDLELKLTKAMAVVEAGRELYRVTGLKIGNTFPLVQSAWDALEDALTALEEDGNE